MNNNNNIHNMPEHIHTYPLPFPIKKRRGAVTRSIQIPLFDQNRGLIQQVSYLTYLPTYLTYVVWKT